MKQKLLNSLRLRAVVLVALLCAVFTGQVWGQSDKSATYTSNVTLSTSGGTSASSAKVKVTGDTQYDAIKAGTSSTAGAMKITVPAGTKYLHLHIAAWKGETVALSLTPNGNLNVSTLSLTSDDGISSNSPFTIKTTANATTQQWWQLSGNY